MTEPTCTEQGYTTYTCHCGDSYVADYVDAYCSSAAYTDVTLGTWYHEYVDFVVEAGMMQGISETEFAPDDALTRAQLVMILYREAGEPDTAGLANPFEDVSEGAWYTDAVVWAASEGIVLGKTETTFDPDAQITREQIATILYRYAGGEAVTEDHLSAYADAGSISGYAVDAMNWAVANGLINGMNDTTLAPGSNATRAQIAKILMIYMGI